MKKRGVELQKLKVAILGSGNIGTDLLIKILRSPELTCSLFIGRQLQSHGILKAQSLGIRTSDRRIDAILEEPDCCDLVFDATSAEDHLHHWPLLNALGKMVVDLTPSHIGKMAVPFVQLDQSLNSRNVNLVSCGGQTSIPLAHAISQVCKDVESIEVVSSIASKSAGPATRLNLDEYIENTERGISFFTHVKKVKAILILNPAEPEVEMQTTIHARIAEQALDVLQQRIETVVAQIQTYVPGYQLVVPPVYRQGKLTMTVKVTGRGDYLPKYAGNLDIINCAAVAVAESFAKKNRAAQKRQGATA